MPSATVDDITSLEEFKVGLWYKHSTSDNSSSFSFKITKSVHPFAFTDFLTLVHGDLCIEYISITPHGTTYKYYLTEHGLARQLQAGDYITLDHIKNDEERIRNEVQEVIEED